MSSIIYHSITRRSIHICVIACLIILCASCTPLPTRQTDLPPRLTPQGASNDSERVALIRWLSAYAVREQASSGVPASITIAQAILETGWFSTETPVRRHMVLDAKNLFGIKGGGPAGSIESPTTEFENGRTIHITDKFRAYHSYSESFEDHSRLLTTSPYYSGALKYRKNPRRYIEEVAKNYATEPDYADSVWSIVQRYNLTRFDK